MSQATHDDRRYEAHGVTRREVSRPISADTPSRTGVELRKADIAFGARRGLRGIDLRVGAGERTALLGPSGVGKTSILRAIAGLDPLLDGEVLVNGIDVSHTAPERRSVVYLHQTPTLFPHLSVQDNIGFPMEVRGATRRDARRRVDALLTRVRMTEFASRMPASLSGGQRHRVALARALAAEPTVLLLDEPFAALDPALRADVRDAVFAMLDDVSGPAVIMVTHDIDEAAALADSIAILLDGAVVQHATPAIVLTRPTSLAVARFLGLPNIVYGVVDGAGAFVSDVGVFDARCAVGPAALVSRADAVRVVMPANHTSRVGGNRTDGEPAVVRNGVVRSVQQRLGGALVRVQVGAHNLSATIRHNDSPSVGDVVAVHIDPARVHVVSLDAADTTERCRV